MTPDIPPQLLTFASGIGLDAQEEEHELEKKYYVTSAVSSVHVSTHVHNHYAFINNFFDFICIFKTYQRYFSRYKILFLLRIVIDCQFLSYNKHCYIICLLNIPGSSCYNTEI